MSSCLDGSSRLRKTEGFTLLEVMIAVAIMSVGATGLLALQSANTIANAQAQNVSRATMANQLWTQRLRRDALEWRDSSPSGLNDTEYLKPLAALGFDGDSDWIVPAAATDTYLATQSFGFNFRGEEVKLDGTEGAVFFCTNVRLRWALDQNAIRADVRTWWHRLAPSGSDQQVDYVNVADCTVGSAADATTGLSDGRRLRAVYSTVLLRPAPL